MTTETKKVRRTTTEEFTAPIVSDEQKPPTPTPQIIQVETQPQAAPPEIDLEYELKRAFNSGDMPTIKLILQDLCETPLEQSIKFLQCLPEGTQATIMIERQTDSMNQQGSFIVPCESPKRLPNYTWYPHTPDESDLYSSVVKKHGGGTYRFEVRYGKGFTGVTWYETLADSAEWIATQKREAENAQIEEMKRQLAAIETQKSQQAQAPTGNVEMMSLKLQLAEMKAANDLALAEMKHTFELERVKAEAAKNPFAETPLALLQLATTSNNSELLSIAKDLLIDQKKGVTDQLFELLENPERAATLWNILSAAGATALSFMGQLPQNAPPIAAPVVNPAPKPPQMTALEKYRQRKANKANDAKTEVSE